MIHRLHKPMRILFDLDGRLADTLPLCIAAFRSAIEPATGAVLCDAEIVATFGPFEEGTIGTIAPNHCDAGMATCLAHYERLHSGWPDLFAGMRGLLGDLRARGVRLGLVTGKGGTSTQLSLRQFGLADYFELIETGSPNGPRKPDALRIILATWQLASTDAVYIGDAPSDITVARCRHAGRGCRLGGNTPIAPRWQLWRRITSLPLSMPCAFGCCRGWPRLTAQHGFASPSTFRRCYRPDSDLARRHTPPSATRNCFS
jgi:phosphoglycolate phosphatase-like HAD superfamily hydrolase